jgi:thiamine-phosphate pyrophosphorylase
VPAPDFVVYLVSDRNQTRDRDLFWVLEQALDAGIKAIQLREKDLDGKQLFLLAEKLRRMCSRYHAALFINDRIDVALAVDADGVQLAKTSLPIPIARELLGDARMIGVSIHSLEEAQEAARSSADFLLFGPVYFTASKAAYGAPQGLAALKKIVENIALPVYAIGGIQPDNVEAVMNTGATGIALISAVLAAADPKAAAATLRALTERR